MSCEVRGLPCLIIHPALLGALCRAATILQQERVVQEHDESDWEGWGLFGKAMEARMLAYCACRQGHKAQLCCAQVLMGLGGAMYSALTFMLLFMRQFIPP